MRCLSSKYAANLSHKNERNRALLTLNNSTNLSSERISRLSFSRICHLFLSNHRLPNLTSSCTIVWKIRNVFKSFFRNLLNYYKTTLILKVDYRVRKTKLRPATNNYGTAQVPQVKITFNFYSIPTWILIDTHQNEK